MTICTPTSQQKQKWEDCFQWIQTSDELLSQEDHVHRQPYDVPTWLSYLEVVDGLIQPEILWELSPSSSASSSSSSSSPQSNSAAVSSRRSQVTLWNLRDLVGRRAVQVLPRSYKLWKHHWEFLVQSYQRSRHLQQQQQQQQQQQKAGLSLSNTDYVVLNASRVVACFERCLWTLSPYPRVWIDYLSFVHRHPACLSVTEVRRLVNRALQAVPLTQHDKIWPSILQWIHGPDRHAHMQQRHQQEKNHSKEASSSSSAMDVDTNEESLNTAVVGKTSNTDPATAWQIPLETRVRLLRRYCSYNPLYRNEFAEFLVHHQRWGEAALQYQSLLNDPHVAQVGHGTSSSSSSTYWEAFCTTCTQHPVEVERAGVPWEKIIRTMLKRGSGDHTSSSSSSSAALLEEDGTMPSSDGQSTARDQDGGNSLKVLEGLLWTQLADSWIRRGSFDIARSVYEEGLQTVKTVRDFSILYDAYLQLEEGLLEAVVESLEEEDEDEEESITKEEDQSDWDILLSEETSHGKVAEMELAMARAEHLTSRRPLLLNAVILRQNPHNVGEWLKRAHLYESMNRQREQAAAVLEKALETVDSSQAGNGNPSELVVQLGYLYETTDGNLSKATALFRKICVDHDYPFQKSDDLAVCWVAWIEFTLRQKQWDEALSLSQQSVSAGPGPRRLNLTKSLRLWDLRLDLEESLGSVQATKDAYQATIDRKVATVQHILNYASFLKDNQFFEESFTGYEKGIGLFGFPHPGAQVLWKAYIDDFIDRHEGTKVERTRDLFQRCLEDCPSEECTPFFLANGQFEEAYGLTKRALSVYIAMAKKVPKEEKLLAYQILIAKTQKYMGVTATREIYQESIEALQDKDAAQMCLQFADMESSLEEPERARAIFVYGAQMADPRRLPEYWNQWNEFEIAHGNEESFREMLRVKRSVEAAYSTVNYNAKGLNEQLQTLSDDQAMQMIADQEGVDHDVAMASANKASTLSGFVPSSAGNKRPAVVANLDDVEARVAKLRKAAAAAATHTAIAEDDSNDDEIDIDEIDAEIEAAAAEGLANQNSTAPEKNSEQSVAAVSPTVNVVAKAVPAGVFGGLIEGTEKKS